MLRSGVRRNAYDGMPNLALPVVMQAMVIRLRLRLRAMSARYQLRSYFDLLR